jgi:hypothetical protein
MGHMLLRNQTDYFLLQPFFDLQAQPVALVEAEGQLLRP